MNFGEAMPTTRRPRLMQSLQILGFTLVKDTADLVARRGVVSNVECRKKKPTSVKTNGAKAPPPNAQAVFNIQARAISLRGGKRGLVLGFGPAIFFGIVLMILLPAMLKDVTGHTHLFDVCVQPLSTTVLRIANAVIAGYIPKTAEIL